MRCNQPKTFAVHNIQLRSKSRLVAIAITLSRHITPTNIILLHQCDCLLTQSVETVVV